MIKKGNVLPSQYFQNPKPDKKIEEIWQDLDGYTFESLYEKETMHNKVDFVVGLPPLKYKGRFIKGMFYSQAVDLIVEKHPGLKKLFFPIANSMLSSYPGSEYADMYFTCYTNLKREKWYKKHHPDRKNVIMLPLQDADFTDEYSVSPTEDKKKDIDIITVSTAYPFKNLPVLAAAIKTYESKYHKKLKAVWIIGSRDAKRSNDGILDYSNMSSVSIEELNKVKEALGDDIEKYIDIYPYIEYRDISKYYTRSKCAVLATLVEGKNRFISEAMSCDVPVVVFKDFNKFARGNYPVFFGNSGEYAPCFTPESLADTIHKVLENLNNYEPRKNYLIHNGRKNFLNTLIDYNPYYKKNLPNYKKGGIFDNLWVDLAIQYNYQISLNDFIYEKNISIQHVQGMKNIDYLVSFLYSKFDVYD